MARTLVVKRAKVAGRTFEMNEKLMVLKGPYRAVISFYRSQPHANGNFGKKDTAYKGEFGFDKFDEKVIAEGLIHNYKTLGIQTKTEAIKNNHNYLCAYLSIWPPGVDGNVDSSKSTVNLYIKAEPNIDFDKKDENDINTEQVVFESSDPNCIEVGGAALKK